MAAKESRIGVLGGMGTGKSYYLQSLVSRLRNPETRGAVGAFIAGGQNSVRIGNKAGQDFISAQGFCEDYELGRRIPRTTYAEQQWLTIDIDYRHGLFAHRRSSLSMDVEDLPGELLHRPLSQENRPVYERVCEHSAVMIFCLPFWVAFPGPSADWREAAKLSQQFQRVVENYIEVSTTHRPPGKVLPIIALTMADDSRGSAPDIRRRWINRYRNPAVRDFELADLHRPGHLCSYLSMARGISKKLHVDLRYAVHESLTVRQGVRNAIDKLGHRRHKPWLLPVSAADESDIGVEQTTGKPVPIHVELPLLAALCLSKNVLM